MQPTIFAEVPQDVRVTREDFFDPVLTIQTPESKSEGVAMPNARSDDLDASVWTRDLSRAMRVSDVLNVRMVSVNTVDARQAMTPFRGTMQSGFGRDLSLYSFDK